MRPTRSSDEHGVIRFWNRSAERIFGFAEAEALGKTLDLIIPENLRDRHWQGYAATMQSGNDALRRRRDPGRAGDAQGRPAHLDRVHDPAVPRRHRPDARDRGNLARRDCASRSECLISAIGGNSLPVSRTQRNAEAPV
jgi:PAS domain-containing protein